MDIEQLYTLVRAGKTAEVGQILDTPEGISLINARDQWCNRTPLHVAARLGHTGMVGLLLQHKANVYERDDSGNTPLHLAATFGHTDAAKLLLAANTKVDIENDKGNTPLHLATQEGHAEVTTLLIQHSANVNKKNTSNVTPLHLGVFNYNNTEAIKRLLAASADVNVRSEGTKTPLRLAVESGQTAIAKLLIEKGAEVDVKYKKLVPSSCQALKVLLDQSTTTAKSRLP